MLPARVVVASVWLAVALAGACSGGDGTKDATPDMPDCAVMFTGEIIDWDSSNASFCGVFNSTVTVRGQQAPADMSNPNGRFEACVPRQAQTLVDVMHSSSASQCVAGSYGRRAILVAEQAVIDANGVFSARVMTQTRESAMFTQIGAPYDAAKAQLVVHVNGTPRAVAISSSHAATQRFNGTTWTADDTGSDVLFPNVDPGLTTVTVTGGAIGTTSITLEAGAYTYLAVIAN